MIGLLSSALVYLVSTFSFEWNTVTYFFISLTLGAVSSAILVIFFLVRAYWNYKYEYITDTEVIRNYEIELKSYYEKVGVEKIGQIVNKEIDEMLVHKYAAAATYNAANNAKKAANLNKANAAIVAVIVFLFLSTPFFILNYTAHKLPKPNTHSEVPMAQNQDSEKNKKPEEIKKPPEKPKEPPNKWVHEFSEEEKKNKNLDKLDDGLPAG